MSPTTFLVILLISFSAELVLSQTTASEDFSGLSTSNILSQSTADCGVPPVSDGAEVLYDNTTYPSVARYKCVPGYSYIGNYVNGYPSMEMNCMQNSRWSGDLPKCERVSCSVPPTILNGILISEGYRYQDQTTYECDPGYILRGSKNSTCQANSQWSPPPACAKVQCGAPPAVKNAGIIALGDLRFGSTVTYKCYPGFQPIIGTETIVCLPSGEWTMPMKCGKTTQEQIRKRT